MFSSDLPAGVNLFVIVITSLSHFCFWVSAAGVRSVPGRSLPPALIPPVLCVLLLSAAWTVPCIGQALLSPTAFSVCRLQYPYQFAYLPARSRALTEGFCPFWRLWGLTGNTPLSE